MEDDICLCLITVISNECRVHKSHKFTVMHVDSCSHVNSRQLMSTHVNSCQLTSTHVNSRKRMSTHVNSRKLT